MEYNQIGRILLLLESRHVPVLFMCVQCVTAILLPPLHVSCGIKGVVRGGAGNLPSTGHPPMRNFTHWSPCEPMTKFGCFKEETLFFSCRLFPTLPRATSFLEILGLAFFFSFLFVCFIWPLLVLDITILLSWRKNKTWIQTVSIRLESIVDFSNEIGCCKINKKRFVVFVLF